MKVGWPQEASPGFACMLLWRDVEPCLLQHTCAKQPAIMARGSKSSALIDLTPTESIEPPPTHPPTQEQGRARTGACLFPLGGAPPQHQHHGAAEAWWPHDAPAGPRVAAVPLSAPGCRRVGWGHTFGRDAASGVGAHRPQPARGPANVARHRQAPVALRGKRGSAAQAKHGPETHVSHGLSHTHTHTHTPNSSGPARR